MNFNWAGNSPGCDLAGKIFSARWESIRNAPATGFYTVLLTVDDGARVFLDGNLVLDAWREQPPTNFSTTVYLTAGAHEWRVEYFQSTGGAQISVNVVAGIIPPSHTNESLASTSNEIIADALSGGWTQGGNGATWRTASNGYNGSALWANNNAFIQPFSNWGRWYPKLLAASNYEIFVYIPKGLATTTNAQYWIYHAGQYDSVAVAQVAYNDAWVSLGTFSFSAQGDEYIALSDVTYEPFGSTVVVWDAVKFVPQ